MSADEIRRACVQELERHGYGGIIRHFPPGLVIEFSAINDAWPDYRERRDNGDDQDESNVQ